MIAAPRLRDRPGRYGIAALGVAAVLGLLVPVVFGSPEPLIHITWKPIADAERAALEQRFGLEQPARVDADTWSYAPRITAPALLRDLIAHPAIADTAGIDRPALRIADNAPLTPRRGGWITLPAGARVMKAAAAAAALAGVVLLLVAALRDRRWSPSALLRGSMRGVPVASAHAAAAFRIAFMSAVLLIVVAEPVVVSDVSAAAVAEEGGVRGAVVRWLAATPAVANVLNPILYISGVLVLAGAGGRVSLAVFAAAFFLWASLVTLRVSHHTIVALQATLIGLLAARWSDVWSVDALLQRRQPLLPDRRYGFAFWLPGFVLGVAFLAAAWAKVGSGLAWVLNGTVKYHFVSDLDQAWVTWGPGLASLPGVAIALSAAAVVIEAILIAASFVCSPRVRLGLGLLAASLLTGFAVFQGIVWPAWWVLLLSFVPWQAFRASNPGPAVSPFASPVQIAVAVAVVVVQLAASVAGRELPPLLSAYDMYSTTYSTPQEYEWASNLEYRVVASTAGGWRDIDGCVVDDVIAARVRESMAAAGRLPATAAEVLSACVARVPGSSAIRLEGDRRVYNWDAGIFEWKRRLDVVGPIDIRAAM